MKPLIGITPSFGQTAYYESNTAYSKAIKKAKAVPIITPYDADRKQLFKHLDGLILSGGGDIDPFYWGEEPQEGLGEVSPIRDRWELEACKYALKIGMPLLGICRGAQVLAIATGGRVCQDIKTIDKNSLLHMQTAPKQYPSHSVDILKDSILEGIFQKSSIRVNSFHHQSIREVGKGIQICAKARDGLIEAIEQRSPFVLGVQWHPELMAEGEKSHQKIFSVFVNQAQQYQKRRLAGN